MKYRTQGITKNKSIKQERSKPIPLSLMQPIHSDGVQNEIRQLGIDAGRSCKDKTDSKAIQLQVYDGT